MFVQQAVIDMNVFDSAQKSMIIKWELETAEISVTADVHNDLISLHTSANDDLESSSVFTVVQQLLTSWNQVRLDDLCGTTQPVFERSAGAAHSIPGSWIFWRWSWMERNVTPQKKND